MAHSGGQWQGRKGDGTLVPLLARGATVREAADAAGVGERTVYRRLNDPTFCRQVADARAGILTATVDELTAGATEAAQRLRALLSSSTETVALGAARALLTHVVSLREHAELTARVEELEEALEVLHGPDGLKSGRSGPQ